MQISDEQWLLLARLAEASVEKWRGHLPPQLDIDDLKGDVVCNIPKLMDTKPDDFSDEGYITSRANFEVMRVVHNFHRRVPHSCDDIDIQYDYEGFERIDVQDELNEALDGFPPLWRKILLLYYSDLNLNQIARRIGIDDTTWVADQIDAMLTELGIETPREAWHKQQMSSLLRLIGEVGELRSAA